MIIIGIIERGEELLLLPIKNQDKMLVAILTIQIPFIPGEPTPTNELEVPPPPAPPLPVFSVPAGDPP